MSEHPPTAVPGIPLVVRIGFAGSRRLLDTAAHPTVNEADFLARVQAHLKDRLQNLRGDLHAGLSK